MQKKYFFWENFIFLRKKGDFSDVFLLFMASVRSRPPGPPAVPGVFSYCFLSMFCNNLNNVNAHACSLLPINSGGYSAVLPTISGQAPGFSVRQPVLAQAQDKWFHKYIFTWYFQLKRQITLMIHTSVNNNNT